MAEWDIDLGLKQALWGGIDKDAEFLYVPSTEVLRIAKEEDAVPYDVPGVELTHEGPLCSFDAFIKKYKLEDKALHRLAEIVRAADTDTLENSPQAPGLLAINLGLGQNFKNDHDLVHVGMILYEALYTWCQFLQAESHGWRPEEIKL